MAYDREPQTGLPRWAKVAGIVVAVVVLLVVVMMLVGGGGGHTIPATAATPATRHPRASPKMATHRLRESTADHGTGAAQDRTHHL